MTILSAKFANEIGDSVEVLTEDRGSALICLPPHEDNINGGQEAFAAWVANGNVPSPYISPSVNSIAAGEACIEQAGFTGSRMVTLLEELLEAKADGTLASRTKLEAVYIWMKTVKAMAKAGAIEFPSCKFTFEEVVTE